MNTISPKEYSEEKIQELFQELSVEVRPSKEVLRATLEKISQHPRPILSPFMSRISPFMKIGTPIFVVALFLLGGAAVITDSPFTPSAPASTSMPLAMSNPNDTSDAALNQDSAVIDSELQSLDSNVSATDQALSYNPSE